MSGTPLRLCTLLLVSAGVAAVPRPGRAAECTAVLQDGSKAFVTQGMLPPGKAGACFTVSAARGVQFVATITRVNIQNMTVGVVNPGDPVEHTVDIGNRFSSGDIGSYIHPADKVDGARTFRFVVTDPIASSPEPFGFRISIDDPADQCLAIPLEGRSTFRAEFVPPTPLHDRCWTVSVPARAQVLAELAPQTGLAIEASARTADQGPYDVQGPAGLQFVSDPSAVKDDVPSGAIRQYKFVVFADPVGRPATGTAELFVTVKP